MNDSYLQHISEQLDAAGLLWGRTRDLVLTVTQHSRLVGELLVCQMTNAALAEALGCSKRTIKRELAALREEGLNWLTFESGQWGHMFRVDTHRPQDRPRTNPGQTQDKGGTDPGQTQDKPGTGTVPATCAPDPYTPHTPTEYSGEEELDAREGAPASDDPTPASRSPDESSEALPEYIQTSVVKAGYHELNPFTLENAVCAITGQLEGSDRRRFVADTLSRLVERQVEQHVIGMALAQDIGRWKHSRSRPPEAPAPELESGDRVHTRISETYRRRVLEMERRRRAGRAREVSHG